MRFSRLIWDTWANGDEGHSSLVSWAHFGAGMRRKLKLKSHPHFVLPDGTAPKLDKATFEEIENAIYHYGTHPTLARAVTQAASAHAPDSADAAREAYERILEAGVSCVEPSDGSSFRMDGGEPRVWTTKVQEISLGLWAAHPERFVPYIYVKEFSQFRELCDEFEIAMPDPPGENSWEKRARYYLDLNDALLEFGARFDLSPMQVAAFLDDFGGDHLVSMNDETLPSPRMAWWQHAGVAGDGVDFEELDEATEESSMFWQGNDQARRGDLAVMWCLSPRSCVHSIWRIRTNGHFDPFSYFSRVVDIGHPVVGLPKLTFADLAADPAFAKWPAVRAHFQGASGRALPPEIYAALVDMYARRKVDITKIPSLERLSIPAGIELEVERDVEERLLEPLLLDLGYTAKSWRRQLPVRMGRGERNYPDYAIGVRGKRGDERCAVVAEAKLALGTDRDIEDAFRQARSYALRLEAKAVVLVAREGLWISERQTRGFPVPRGRDRIGWVEAQDPTVRAGIVRKIGPEPAGA